MIEYKLGQQIGKLKIVQLLTIKQNKITSICVCECGNTVELPLFRLKKTRSCGCTWHHKSNTKVYYAWCGMRNRCYDISNKEYKNYGNRGIIVCEGFNSFNIFYKIMGEPPNNRYSNDRIDNTKNYTCGECDECKRNGWKLNTRWATPKQQAQNKRSNILVEVDGDFICLAEYLRNKKLPYSTISMRLNKYGWDLKKAISTPINKKKNVNYSD